MRRGGFGMLNEQRVRQMRAELEAAAQRHAQNTVQFAALKNTI